MDAEALSALIGRMYEAATAQSENWQAVLRDVIAATRARTGWLHSWPRAPPSEMHVLGSIGIASEALDAYADHYCAIDPWCSAVLRLTAGELMLSHEHVAPDVYDKTEIFNDYVLPNLGDTAFIASAAISLSSGGFASLGLHRLRSAGPFDGPDVVLLRALLPHIGHAISIRNRIGVIGQERELARATLDRIATAAAVLDGCGKVLLFNNAARLVFACKDGLQLGAAAVLLVANSLQADFACAIARAVSGHGVASALRIERPSGHGAWQVLIAPLSSIGVPERRVLMLVGEPGDALPSERAIIDAFGLTRAEANVAGAVASGERVKAIARANRVSVATVRAQLSAVLAKTGTERQADLTRLLMRFPRLHPSNE